MLLINPKNPDDQIEVVITEDQAKEVLRKKLPDNPFAQSLLNQYPRLSESQKFWFFKLAVENQDKEPVKLLSDLEQFIKPFGFLQFKVGEIDVSINPAFEEIKKLGKIKFLSEKDKITVISGTYPAGEIRGDSFYPRNKCPLAIIAQMIVFSEDPIPFLELFGKATGYCCVCGRLLTNEGSVERGIGPICAEKYGL